MLLKSDWWLKYTQSNKNKVYELKKTSKNDIIAYTQNDNFSTLLTHFGFVSSFKFKLVIIHH